MVPVNRATRARQVLAKKAKLLAMARAGDRRPSQINRNLRLRRLGWSLSNYTLPSCGAYDEEFSQTIRKIRPDWFGCEWSVKRKLRHVKVLVKKVDEGRPRPSLRRQRLTAQALTRYTTRSKSHDEDFNGMARALCPDWFIDHEEIRRERMAEFLKLAQSGAPRPHGLWRLNLYMRTYPEFREEIIAANPEWQYLDWELLRNQAIDLARSGAPRPDPSTPLGKYISHMNPSRNLVMRLILQRMRPDWFRREVVI
jgi:hypothetical protein